VSERDLAVVELLGALTYGQLRAFVAAASAVAMAPDVGVAEELADHAAREHDRYARLRARLAVLTDLPQAVLERQRGVFDAFFSATPDDWATATTNLAVGLPMAADFARAVAPAVDDDTAAVLVEALTDRAGFEDFALRELHAVLESDPSAVDEARRDVAGLVGRALTGYQEVLGETDALRVLFEQHARDEGLTSEGLTKRLAMQVLGEHRRRMLSLGIDDLE
jgi:hypothetical protein